MSESSQISSCGTFLLFKRCSSLLFFKKKTKKLQLNLKKINTFIQRLGSPVPTKKHEVTFKSKMQMQKIKPNCELNT